MRGLTFRKMEYRDEYNERAVYRISERRLVKMSKPLTLTEVSKCRVFAVKRL